MSNDREGEIMLFSKKATEVLEKQTEMLEEKEYEREEKAYKEEKEKLEFKDIIAMWVAGVITFLPAILLICTVFGFVIWFFFLRFA